MGSFNVVSSKNAMKQWRERQNESPLIDQHGLVVADPREPPHVPLTYSPSRQSDDDDTAIVGAFLLGSLF